MPVEPERRIMISHRRGQVMAPLTQPMRSEQPGPGTLIARPVRRTPTRHPPSIANLDTDVQPPPTASRSTERKHLVRQQRPPLEPTRRPRLFWPALAGTKLPARVCPKTGEPNRGRPDRAGPTPLGGERNSGSLVPGLGAPKNGTVTASGIAEMWTRMCEDAHRRSDVRGQVWGRGRRGSSEAEGSDVFGRHHLVIVAR